MNMSIQKYINTGISTGLRLLLLTMPMVIASCDDHEHLDTAIHIGHVVCSDGRTMSVEECEKMQKEPVAVVFYGQYLLTVLQQQGWFSFGRCRLLCLALWSECLYSKCCRNASAQCLSSRCQFGTAPMWWRCHFRRCWRLLVLDQYGSQRSGRCQGVAVFPRYWSHPRDTEDRGTPGEDYHHITQII